MDKFIGNFEVRQNREKRILDQVLSYNLKLNNKILEYIEATQNGLANQDEFRKYLKESLPKINIELNLMKKLETDLGIDSEYLKESGELLDHVKEINLRWNSTASIIGALIKGENIIKEYNIFKSTLEKNNGVISKKTEIIKENLEKYFPEIKKNIYIPSDVKAI